jgi:transcription elongation factor Elf1
LAELLAMKAANRKAVAIWRRKRIRWRLAIRRKRLQINSSKKCKWCNSPRTLNLQTGEMSSYCDACRAKLNAGVRQMLMGIE